VNRSQIRSKRSLENVEPCSYECDKCQDQCVVIDYERNIAVQCTCVKQRRINKVLKHSNIGDEFRSKTFGSFDLKGKDTRIVQAYRLARGYADRFNSIRSSDKNGFGIAGAVGIGKTHLLCAIANQLLNQGVGVRYFNFVTGFKEMFAKYDDGGQAVEEIRWELMNCDVLMLDDIAKGKRKGKAVDISKSVYDEIYGIVDYRYFNRLPIIWSSEMYAGLSRDEVLGEATATRLIEKSHIANVMYGKNEQFGSLNYRLRNFAG
jgi:DNA replication protein DnaC